MLLREGSRHSVFVNQLSRRVSTVPRHREINQYLAHRICRDLGVPDPRDFSVRQEVGSYQIEESA